MVELSLSVPAAGRDAAIAHEQYCVEPSCGAQRAAQVGNPRAQLSVLTAGHGAVVAPEQDGAAPSDGNLRVAQVDDKRRVVAPSRGVSAAGHGAAIAHEQHRVESSCGAQRVAQVDDPRWEVESATSSAPNPETTWVRTIPWAPGLGRAAAPTAA